MKTKILILTLALGVAMAQAGAETREERKEFVVGFGISSCVINPAYGRNAEQLQRLDALLDSVADGTLTLDGPIEVEGWTSPDGPRRLNEDLARRRQNALRDYIVKRHPDLSGRIVESEPVVAWQQLADLIAATDEPWRDEVLAIIADAPAVGRADTRNARLKALRRGTVWQTLAKKYLPQLRMGVAAAVTIFIEPEPEPQPIPQPVISQEPMPEPEATDTIVIEEAVPVTLPDSILVEAVKPNRYWSITTNMLYDALAVPNVGFDVYLGKNFSLMGNWQYAWWSKKTSARYWRTYGGYVGARWWFGDKAAEKPLQGHHIGVYAQMLLYDFEWGGKGYLSGIPGKNIFHRPTWGAGVEYGYSLPVSRHLNIDFNVGIGYLTGRYQEYEPHDGHFVWLSTKNRHYFGPTKLEVSLVWQLGNGNVNPKKGGAK